MADKRNVTLRNLEMFKDLNANMVRSETANFETRVGWNVYKEDIEDMIMVYTEYCNTHGLLP